MNRYLTPYLISKMISYAPAILPFPLFLTLGASWLPLDPPEVLPTGLACATHSEYLKDVQSSIITTSTTSYELEFPMRLILKFTMIAIFIMKFFSPRLLSIYQLSMMVLRSSRELNASQSAHCFHLH